MACAISNGMVGTVAVELTGSVEQLQHESSRTASEVDLLL
jgi:hypothetical protein